MKRLTVGIDLGHTFGSGGRPPAVVGHFSEAAAIRQQCRGLEEGLLGHAEVVLFGFGRYADRQTYARENGVDVYLALHANVGADYGLVLGDYRHAEKSAQFRGMLQAHFTEKFGDTAYRKKDRGSKMISDVVGPSGYRELNPWPAGAYTLIRTFGSASISNKANPRRVGLVLELGSVGHPDHQPHWHSFGVEAAAVLLGWWRDHERTT